MSIRLDLSADVEAKLRDKAAAMGLSVEGLAMDILTAVVQTDSQGLSGKELVEIWRQQGIIGSRTVVASSAEHASALRQRAEQRSG